MIQLQGVILRFAYDCENPPISCILLCIFMKQRSKYRACDAEENGLQVDEPSPSKKRWKFEKKIIFNKDKERSLQPKGLFFANVRNFF